jgi:hypothetical protein
MLLACLNAESAVMLESTHRGLQLRLSQAFSGGFSALPARKKTFPLGQSLDTSHRLQSGLRA